MEPPRRRTDEVAKAWLKAGQVDASERPAIAPVGQATLDAQADYTRRAQEHEATHKGTPAEREHALQKLKASMLGS